jgi:hypothetical protein
MITAILLAAALVAKPDPELPKHWAEYPQKEWEALLAGCFEAGRIGKHDPEKMEAYCTCHLFSLIEIAPYSEFKAAKDKGDVDSLFARAHNICVNFGLGPGNAGEKQKKPDQKPSNPLKARRGSSVA